VNSCAWTDDGEAWATGCGQLFCLNDGGPTENDMRWCCFCGKPLVEVPFDEAVEDDEQ
jgi:hypothetical protein